MKHGLTESDLEAPAIKRIRRGRGFQYRDPQGRPLDEQTRLRVESLVIPPAWREVWISPEPNGHIQAVGTDEAGRRQYLYHSNYLKQGSRKKFRRARKLGLRVHGLRRALRKELRQTADKRLQASALAVLLVDHAHLRIGNRVYAQQHGTFGVTTLRCEHLVTEGGKVILDFPGKSGQQWHLEINDREIAQRLGRFARREPSEPLLGYPEQDAWQALSSQEVNAHIKELTGRRFTAKDFRTWQGTMIAARSLRRAGTAEPEAAWAEAAKHVAAALNNTVSVASSAYIDPALEQLHRQGKLQSPKRLTDKWLAQALRTASIN